MVDEVGEICDESSKQRILKCDRPSRQVFFTSAAIAGYPAGLKMKSTRGSIILFFVAAAIEVCSDERRRASVLCALWTLQI